MNTVCSFKTSKKFPPRSWDLPPPPTDPTGTKPSADSRHPVHPAQDGFLTIRKERTNNSISGLSVSLRKVSISLRSVQLSKLTGELVAEEMKEFVI